MRLACGSHSESSCAHAQNADRLLLFQFPRLFPQFHAPGPIDVDDKMDNGDVKPDVKPAAGQLKGRRKIQPLPPAGQVGKLQVMKSGKVRMVLGNDIMMDVGWLFCLIQCGHDTRLFLELRNRSHPASPPHSLNISSISTRRPRVRRSSAKCTSNTS